IRMARYLAKDDLEPYVEKMVMDDSPQVRREAAIALRHLGTPKAAELWASLAQGYEAGDRWYLEALGIGSDRFPDLYFKAWKNRVGEDWMDEKGKDIVWRSRASASVPLLAEIIRDQDVSEKELPSYFRAFSFKENPRKNDILLSFLNINHPLDASIQAYAVGQLDTDFLNASPQNIRRVKNVLPRIKGTPEWLMAIKKFKFRDRNEALFDFVVTGTDEALRKEAAGVLFEFGGSGLVNAFLKSDAPESSKMEVLGVMNSLSNPDAIALLSQNIQSGSLPFPLIQRAVEALGNTGEGQEELYGLLENGKLPQEHKTAAVLKLMTSWNDEIRTNAPRYLDSNTDQELNIDALVQRTGNIAQGAKIYATYCSSCHVAGTTGMEFGPALSDIGNKLSKQFLYSSIIYPSAGINFGYEGYSVKMKDGSTATGYILSRSEDVLTLKMMGGTQKEIPLAEIENLEAMDTSLMTEGLAKIMSKDDLIDLVEYLGTLKIDQDRVASNAL
ncbi:MAG TPA: c-type cytochrome, partial [Pricia sp.]|nr:c-type cytochrome [Pricia sp.]